MEAYFRVSLTQNQWIPKYNDAKKVMASAADYYWATKLGDKKVLRILQADINSNFITSTRIIYNPENMEGRIIHYYGSDIIKPVEKELYIPEYPTRPPLKFVFTTGQDLKFFQALFLTTDKKEEIIETLEKLGNKKENKSNIRAINILTHSQNNRKIHPQGVSLFRYYYTGNLLIDNSRELSVQGYSYEVPQK